MILIVLLFLLFIYIHFGVLTLIQIILCIIVFLLSNLLMGINPFSKELYIIRLLSLFTIICILYYNSITYSIVTVSILPLSIKRIHYYDEFRVSKNIDSNSKKETFLVFKDIEKQISNFLFKLDFNDNFIVILEFIPKNRYFELDAPLILLSKPIIINRFSSAKTISHFIYEKLDFMMYFYEFNSYTFLEYKYRDGAIINLKYAKFYHSNE